MVSSNSLSYNVTKFLFSTYIHLQYKYGLKDGRLSDNFPELFGFTQLSLSCIKYSNTLLYELLILLVFMLEVTWSELTIDRCRRFVSEEFFYRLLNKHIMLLSSSNSNLLFCSNILLYDNQDSSPRWRNTVCLLIWDIPLHVCQ